MRIMGFCLLLAGVLAPMAALEQTTLNATQILATAEPRIEQYRKGDVRIRVLDNVNEPVPDAEIRVEQLRHSFLFGANAFPLLNHKDREQEELYQRRFTELLNYATLGFYWGAYERSPGQTEAVKLEDQARWLKQRGIVSKGHPLVWHEVFPAWGPSDPEETRKLLERRITHTVTRFAGLIDRWDVVNEAQVSADVKNGVGAWAKRDGPAAMVEAALRWARAANPKALLLYNDYKLDEGYVLLAQDLFRRGAPVDAFGLQSHMHGGDWPLEKLWAESERFNRLGKPLHWTEMTVISGEHGWQRPLPWPTTPEGEARQADYVEKAYTILFSHPAVEAITWWDLMDGAWQGAPAGLVRADLSPKPAYERLMKLIKGRWWTTADLKSDSRGMAEFRGFGGRYRIQVKSGSRSAVVEEEIAPRRSNEVVLRLRQ